MKRHRQDFMDANGVVVPEETETHIYGLFGKYRALSNFEEAMVAVDGYEYQTSEAAYMAEKTTVIPERINLTAFKTGKEAKLYGQKVTLRPDWDEVKVSAMEKVLKQKFLQNDRLRRLLLSTGDKYLEETNWWGDKFWGVCGGEGRNELGLCLMRVRDYIRKLSL